MSRKCQLTEKGPLAGNNVSHAHNKTKTRQLPNLQKKSIFVPELGKSLKLRLSTRAIRTIDKVGLMSYLKSNGLTIKDLS